MILFLSGVAVGLVPFLVILAVAIARSGKTTSPHPQNSIQHVQEHVVAVKTNKNGEKHAY